MSHPALAEPVLWKGAFAGLAAGLVASFAMDRFQAAVAALSSDGQEGEPATQKAADRFSEMATGRRVPEDDRPLAGQAVHYGLGCALGAAYGAMAEYRPAVTVGGGTAFGLGVAARLDEGLVPAVGLGDAPWNTSPSTHLYTGASHAVFGASAEVTRRLVRHLLR